jgi:hypothetical protein
MVLQRTVGYVIPFYLGLCEALVLKWLPDVPPVGVVSAPSVAAAAAAVVAPFMVAPLHPRIPRLLPAAELLQSLRVPLFVALVFMFGVTMTLVRPASALSSMVQGSQFFNLTGAGLAALISYSLAVAYVEARNQVA